MCFCLTVYLSPADALNAKEIALVSSEVGILEVTATRFSLFKKASNLTISDGRNSCACGLLADSADWDALTWDLVPEVLPSLSGTMKKIRTLCRGDFELEAAFAGDKSETAARVSVDKLADLIEQGRLGNKVRYIVTETVQA